MFLFAVLVTVLLQVCCVSMSIVNLQIEQLIVNLMGFVCSWTHEYRPVATAVDAASHPGLSVHPGTLPWASIGPE